MKDERVYLEYILVCLDRVQEEAARGELSFRHSKTVQDSILMNLAIVGETIKSLSAATRAMAPDVPWRQIARLRDMIVHRYQLIDRNEIWDIVRLDILPFREQIEDLLEDLNQASEDTD